jgi:GH25 family lysozyme M1 (1,4-beta-N-acetylmuramidase)
MKGIDISKWQNTIDWKKTADSGVQFAIIRNAWGSKSSAQIDKKFKENLQNAKNNGILCGVYHYTYADNASNARDEASFCLENIAGEKLEFPVVFDIEDRQLLVLSNSQRTEIAAAFCDEIEKAGYYAMIYCSLDWYKNYLDGVSLSKKYDIWLAQWNNNDSPDIECGIWQYTDSGKVGGISTSVDLNIAYKDYPKIMEEKKLNGFSKENLLYTVQKNDSLWGIARKFLGDGTRYPEIMGLNNFSSDIIYPGQVLKIPNISLN